jgi:riboflavin kinase/FMN adenylyltransferase
VTIGVFDGMHRGHASLIRQTVEVAERNRLPTVLVTFDPHPARLVGPARDTSALSTPQRRADLAGPLGVHAVLVLEFTTGMARTPPETFVRQVLVDLLRAQAVVVGGNFRFGTRGSGDVALLHRLGRRYGFTTEGVDLLGLAGFRCSSTYIRNCLGNGDIAAASQALGRPHRVEGRMTDHVLEVAPGTALPALGGYRALLAVNGHEGQEVDVLVHEGGVISVSGCAVPPGVSPAVLDFLPPPIPALG